MAQMPISTSGSMTSWLGHGCVFAAIAALLLPLPPTGLVACVAIGAGLLLLDAQQSGGQRDRVLLLLGGLFLLSSLFSVLFSRETERALMSSVSLIPSVFLGLLVGFKMRLPWFRYFSVLFALLLTLAAIYLLSIAFSNPDVMAEEWLRLSAYRLFSVPNDLLLFSLLSPFAINLLFYGVNWGKKIIGLAAFLLTLVVCIWFKSRAGVLLLMLATFVMLFKRSPRVFIGSLLVLWALFFIVDFLNDFAMIGKMASIWTASSRIPLWLAAWRMFLDAPLLGLGPGAFSEFYSTYVADMVLPEWIVFDSRHMPWAHNLYMESLAERGVIGIATLLSLIARMIYLLWPISGKPDLHGHLAQASLVSLSLMLVAGLFELSLLRLWFTTFFFLMIGIVLMVSSEGTTHETETE
jgi:O-antigen ligase